MPVPVVEIVAPAAIIELKIRADHISNLDGRRLGDWCGISVVRDRASRKPDDVGVNSHDAIGAAYRVKIDGFANAIGTWSYPNYSDHPNCRYRNNPGLRTCMSRAEHQNAAAPKIDENFIAVLLSSSDPNQPDWKCEAQRLRHEWRSLRCRMSQPFRRTRSGNAPGNLPVAKLAAESLGHKPARVSV